MPPRIKQASDLITTHGSVRAGFLRQAVSKGERANPFIVRAKEFEQALKKVKDPAHLIVDLPSFREEIVAAMGFSTKALNHLNAEELDKIIGKALTETLTEKDFRQQLVHRYLLTKGDALGGTMRNVIGSAAGTQLVDFILNELKNKKITPEKEVTKAGKITEISWKNRSILLDQTPKFIGKNIDAILLDIENKDGKLSGKEAIMIPDQFLACGELKGGIDPAGADEHWKTANSALERIRVAFADKKHKPLLFFVGAAIEASMADEIFEQLKDGRLTYAANLNSLEQMEDLVGWLISL